ncbi:PREDICTED: uncharacterized protein LOC101293787 [Fragaria vesca subsp. vesca]
MERTKHHLGPYPSDDQVDALSSDDSSSSNAQIEVITVYNHNKQLTSEGALMGRTYRGVSGLHDTPRGSVILFTCIDGFRSVKQLYGQHLCIISPMFSGGSGTN